MKKFFGYLLISLLFIILCLFLSLNQECFATDSDVIFINNDCGIEWNLTELLEQYNIEDFILDNDKQYILWNYIPNGWYVLFISEEFYLDDDDYLCSNDFMTIRANPLPQQQYIDICSHTNEIGSVLLNENMLNIDTRYNALYTSPNTIIYQDDTWTSQLDLTNINGITHNANDVSNLTDNNGGGNEEEEENTFFTNLLQFVIHIFIPNENDMLDIIDDFQDNILDNFAIVPLRRSSSYSARAYYDPTYDASYPRFDIYGYTFDLGQFKNAIEQPIFLGYLQKHAGGGTYTGTPVVTNDIKIKDIFNFLFTCELIALNISLYNKFFEKE